jgi:hypothetical protein
VRNGPVVGVVGNKDAEEMVFVEIDGTEETTIDTMETVPGIARRELLEVDGGQRAVLS